MKQGIKKILQETQLFFTTPAAAHFYILILLIKIYKHRKLHNKEV